MLCLLSAAFLVHSTGPAQQVLRNYLSGSFLCAQGPVRARQMSSPKEVVILKQEGLWREGAGLAWENQEVGGAGKARGAPAGGGGRGRGADCTRLGVRALLTALEQEGSVVGSEAFGTWLPGVGKTGNVAHGSPACSARSPPCFWRGTSHTRDPGRRI